MKTKGLVAALLAPLAAAQGPGAGQVNGGPAAQGPSGTLVVSASSTSSESQTSGLGPWSSVEYLEGTWSSKSGMVVTGPDFYDPVDELLIEPALPGMSFSFTKDGFFEQALYQVTSNPKQPECPTGTLIFQHGKYEMDDSGKLTLNPFKVDGRQLLSDPCGQSSSESIYSRYNQTEEYERFMVTVDTYHGRYRLDLFQFDGTPVPPMYLVYKPPQMLPTVTMNPTASGTGSAAASATTAANARLRVRRALENRSKTKATLKNDGHYDLLWWLGITLMAVGGTGYVFLS